MPMKLSLSQSARPTVPPEVLVASLVQTPPLSPSVFGGAFIYFGTIL